MKKTFVLSLFVAIFALGTTLFAASCCEPCKSDCVALCKGCCQTDCSTQGCCK